MQVRSSRVSLCWRVRWCRLDGRPAALLPEDGPRKQQPRRVGAIWRRLRLTFAPSNVDAVIVGCCYHHPATARGIACAPPLSCAAALLCRAPLALR